MEIRLSTFTFFLLLASIQAKKRKDIEIIVQHKPDRCPGVAKAEDNVQVHFTGRLEDGVVFDTSRKSGRSPLSFNLGEGTVIPGWELGITGMCVGEKRKLKVPPHLAYGEHGYPPKIPGGATLIFEIELIAIKRPAANDTSTFGLLRFLAMPAAFLFVAYCIYEKYQETERKRSSKRKLKEERRNKKR